MDWFKLFWTKWSTVIIAALGILAGGAGGAVTNQALRAPEVKEIVKPVDVARATPSPDVTLLAVQNLDRRVAELTEQVQRQQITIAKFETMVDERLPKSRARPRSRVEGSGFLGPDKRLPGPITLGAQK